MEYVLIAVILVLVLVIYFNAKQKSAQRKKEEFTYQQYLKKFDAEKSVVKLPPMETSVAGVKYKNDDTGIERQSIISKSKVGERLMLLPDELNKFDDDAVRVVKLSGEQIGFLNTDLALEIKPRLKKGARVDAVITELNGKKGEQEVVIELTKYSRKGSK